MGMRDTNAQQKLARIREILGEKSHDVAEAKEHGTFAVITVQKDHDGSEIIYVSQADPCDAREEHLLVLDVEEAAGLFYDLEKALKNCGWKSPLDEP